LAPQRLAPGDLGGQRLWVDSLGIGRLGAGGQLGYVGRELGAQSLRPIVAHRADLRGVRDTARHATAAVAVTVRAAAVLPAGVCQATEAAPIGTRNCSADAPSAAADATSDVLLASIAFSQPSTAMACPSLYQHQQ
jgi:hypothetical protein